MAVTTMLWTLYHCLPGINVIVVIVTLGGFLTNYQILAALSKTNKDASNRQLSAAFCYSPTNKPQHQLSMAHMFQAR